MDDQLKKLLAEHKQYFSLNEAGKVEGSKFQKLKKRVDADAALAKYEPFIVKSKNFPTMLYCQLTGQLIDQSIDALQRHMKGKKFIKGSERYRSDQQELRPEPDIESLPGITKCGPPREKRSKSRSKDTPMADAGADAEAVADAGEELDAFLQEAEQQHAQGSGSDEGAEGSGGEDRDEEAAGASDMDFAMDEEAAAAGSGASHAAATGSSMGAEGVPGGAAAGGAKRWQSKQPGRQQGNGVGQPAAGALAVNGGAGVGNKAAGNKKKHTGRPAATKRRKT